jgi:hypothetical protein
LHTPAADRRKPGKLEGSPHRTRERYEKASCAVC